MKKKHLKSLNLNKKLVSNLTKSTVTGGRTNGVTRATICLRYKNADELLTQTNTLVTNFVSGGIHRTCANC